MKKFEQLVFSEFGQMDDYDQILHQFNSIRGIMSDIPSFKKMTINMQYHYCVSIALIVTQTLTGQIMRDKPISPCNDGGGKYDVVTGAKRFDTIEIKNRKLIGEFIIKLTETGTDTGR